MSSKTKQQIEDENKLPPKLEENKEIIKEYEGDVHMGVNTDDINDGKIILETKPREEYLQKKIEEMNIDNKIITGVTKGLGISLDFIKNDIDDEKVLITEVTNENKIKKYVVQNEEKEKIHKTDEQNVMSKKNLQKLRNFRYEKDKLNNKIIKLETKKKFIEDEGMMNLGEVEQNLKNNELKKIKDETSSCNRRINILDYHIKNILAEESNLTRREKIKNYLNHFDKDRNDIQLKEYSKKYKEKKEQLKKIEEQIELNSQREMEKIEENKKKKEQMILENAKKIIEKERENREKIKKQKEEKDKETKEKLQKHNEEKTEEQKEIDKRFINLKKNQCIYYRNQKQFIQNEKQYFKTEIDKIKSLYYSVTLDEIKQFKKKMKRNHSKNMTDIEEKYNKIKEDWKKNKEDLPKFKCHFREIAQNEAKKLLKEEQKQKSLIKEHIKARKDYSEIQQEKKPEISEKLKKIREDNIKKLTEKKIVKDTLFNHKKGRILLVKRDPSKPSKYNWDLKLDYIDDKNPLLKSAEIKKNLIRKPKRIIVSSSTDKRKNLVIPPKKIDYLKEFERKRNITEINSDNENSIKREKAKWERIIKDNKGTIKQNIQNVKMKADHLEHLANEKEKILKYKGGIEKNPELGQKISDLLIDSIQAKLTILQSIESN